MISKLLGFPLLSSWLTPLQASLGEFPESEASWKAREKSEVVIIFPDRYTICIFTILHNYMYIYILYMYIYMPYIYYAIYNIYCVGTLFISLYIFSAPFSSRAPIKVRVSSSPFLRRRRRSCAWTNFQTPQSQIKEELLGPSGAVEISEGA